MQRQASAPRHPELLEQAQALFRQFTRVGRVALQQCYIGQDMQCARKVKRGRCAYLSTDRHALLKHPLCLWAVTLDMYQQSQSSERLRAFERACLCTRLLKHLRDPSAPLTLEVARDPETT